MPSLNVSLFDWSWKFSPKTFHYVKRVRCIVQQSVYKRWYFYLYRWMQNRGTDILSHTSGHYFESSTLIFPLDELFVMRKWSKICLDNNKMPSRLSFVILVFTMYCYHSITAIKKHFNKGLPIISHSLTSALNWFLWSQSENCQNTSASPQIISDSKLFILYNYLYCNKKAQNTNQIVLIHF